MLRFHSSWIIAFIFMIHCDNVAAHLNSDQLKSELELFQAQQNSLTNKLNYNLKKEEKIHQQLASLDHKIAQLSELKRTSEKTKRLIIKSINDLNNQKNELKKEFKTHEKILKLIVINNFETFKKNQLQIILNQESWENWSRLNAYYKAIYSSRIDKIKAAESYFVALEQNSNHIQAQSLALKKIDDSLQEIEKKLSQKKISRVKTQQKLNQIISSQTKQQEKIIHEIEKIVRLLQQIPDKKSNSLQTKPISMLKGSLPNPIKIFQQQNITPNKKSLFINASIGEPVYSVHPGQVVFSQWLKGIGMLIILDHGEGFLSLYGNNQILYKEVGDFVSEQELIARVGESGTYGRAGLYFEIRRDGLAQTIQEWLRLS